MRGNQAIKCDLCGKKMTEFCSCDGTDPLELSESTFTACGICGRNRNPLGWCSVCDK